ncbi:MAG: T9SS type A sorting domain-containing protein, partial [Bacteroidales bacterium]|nr:T9SS type A sorting domain-containing protein [Bacteroidales bacterium]
FGSVIFIDYYGNCDAPWGEYPEDYDNDGDLDLLVSMVSEEKFYIYENDGLGNFTKTQVIENIHSLSYCSSDVNLDGNIDIVITANDNIYYYQNDGSGSFLSPTIIFADLDPYSIIAADLTNDNYDEIIYSAPGWLENNQDETFQSHEVDQWGASLNMASGDLDNDGDIDFTTACRTQRCVYFAENINAGEVVITNLPINVKNGNPEHVEVGDLTNDGYLDIIIGSWPDEGVFWAENYQYRILNQPTDQYVCEEEKAYFSVLSTGVVEYQWQLFNGSGFSNITNNSTYSGVNKAQLIIDNITEDMFGNQYKCRVYDKSNSLIITEVASLYAYSPSILCPENQSRMAEPSNTYMVVENEFDLDTIYNKCNENLNIINSYNNAETLAGEVLEIGVHEIEWQILNAQNEIIDECVFEIEIFNFVGIEPLTKDDITIIPNPSNGIFILDLSFVELQGNTQLTISNLAGEIIKQLTVRNKQTLIDISDQANGIYFLRIQTEATSIVRRIIKN